MHPYLGILLYWCSFPSVRRSQWMHKDARGGGRLGYIPSLCQMPPDTKKVDVVVCF